MIDRLRRIEHGWRVAAAGALNMVVTSGPTYQGASTLFAALEADLQWSRTLITGVASFGRFGGAALGPFEGFMVDRFGPARMALIGMVLGGIGFLLFSQIRGAGPYFAAYMLITIGFSVGGFIPSMSAVNNWLPRRRAAGIAIVLAGSSLGAFIVPLMAWGIVTHGWRPTTAAIGIVAIVVAPIVARTFSGPRPRRSEQAGTAAVRGQPPEPPPSAGDFTASEALRTRAFWALAISHMFANMALAGLSAHSVLHLTDIGLSLPKAASVIPVIGAMSFAGQITGGVIGDQVPRRLAIALLLLAQAGAMVLFSNVSGYGAAIVFAAVWGLSLGARSPIFHAMRAEYFGRKAFGAIMGLSGLPMAIGMTAVPVLVGLAFDIQETYRWAFLSLAATSVAGGLVVLAATRPVHPSQRRPLRRSP